LFVITFIMSLIILKVQFDLFMTCSVVAVSRCMCVIPGTNISGGALCFLSCLEFPSVSACHRGSNLLLVII
jgi:hypothetical protein